MGLKSKVNTAFFFLKPKKVVAHYKIFNADEWLEASIFMIIRDVYKVVITISDRSWGESMLDSNPSNETILTTLQQRYPGKVVINRGSWKLQLDQVEAGLEFIKQHIPEATHLLYIDTDEIYEHGELKKLLSLARKLSTFNREIRIHFHSYFKSPYYRIDPEEPLRPMALFPIRNFVHFIGIRTVNLGFVEAHIWLHHMSYVRKNDEDIRRKMLTHKEDESTDISWYETVYCKWSPEHTNFHPKQPELFKGVKVLSEQEVPAIISKTYHEWNKPE